MGLDMYLQKKTYVQNWAHQDASRKHTVSVKLGGKLRKDIKPERISYVVEQVAYWRKFNALHNWFVQECGDGKDECQEMYVQIEQLEELRDKLSEVITLIGLSKKITKVLKDWNGEEYEVSTYDCEDELRKIFPPTSGFFFGSTEIDDYYVEDVKKTIEIIDDLSKEFDQTKELGLFCGDLYYQASW